MRTVLVLLILVGCSSAKPKLSEEVAARLKTLASDCTEKPGTPGPPHGYHTEVTCHPPGDSLAAHVYVFLLDRENIGGVQIGLAEPVETAIPRLEHALKHLVPADDFVRLAGRLRAADKDNVGYEQIAVEGYELAIGVRRSPPVVPVEVQVTLWWRD